MNKLAPVLIAATITSCSWFQKNVEQPVSAAIDCIKEAEKEASAGKDPIQIAEDIGTALGQSAAAAAASAIATGGDVVAALEAALDGALPGLYTQYGEPAVACVFHRAAPATAAAKASTDPTDIAILDIITKHGWQFTAPAGK